MKINLDLKPLNILIEDVYPVLVSASELKTEGATLAELYDNACVFLDGNDISEVYGLWDLDELPQAGLIRQLIKLNYINNLAGRG